MTLCCAMPECGVHAAGCRYRPKPDVGDVIEWTPPTRVVTITSRERNADGTEFLMGTVATTDEVGVRARDVSVYVDRIDDPRHGTSRVIRGARGLRRDELWAAIAAATGPAQRLSMVQDAFERGDISKDEALFLLDFKAPTTPEVPHG